MDVVDKTFLSVYIFSDKTFFIFFFFSDKAFLSVYMFSDKPFLSVSVFCIMFNMCNVLFICICLLCDNAKKINLFIMFKLLNINLSIL